MLLAMALAFLIAGCGTNGLMTAFGNKYTLSDSTRPVSLAWTFHGSSPLRSPTLLLSDTSVLFRTDHQVLLVNLATGAEKWRIAMQTAKLISPIADDARIFVADGQQEVLYALDIGSGTILWEFRPGEHVSAQVGKPWVYDARLQGSVLYIVVNLRRGTDLFAVDASTGSLLSRAPEELRREGVPPSALFITHDSVVVHTNTTWIFSRDLSTVQGRSPKAIEAFRPATYSNGIAFTNGKTISAVSVTDHREWWRFAVECPYEWDQFPESPVVVGNDLFVFSTCGQLYRLSAETGEVIWRYDSPTGVASVAVGGDTVYLVAQNATVTSISVDTGQSVGKLSFLPMGLAQTDFQHIQAGEHTIVVTLGNHQAFVFVK
jgi:outer membrane protein assembly factor BamB